MDELHPTKKLIFDAITQLLTEEGIEGVTYSNISARTYLQRASIAYHFRGRQDMLTQYYKYYLIMINFAAIPEEMMGPPKGDPVSAFCQLIDMIMAKNDMEDDPAGDALYRHMLISSLTDLEAKNLLRQANERAEKLTYQMLRHYIEAGIIEESRIPLAIAEMSVYSVFSSFADLFDFNIHNYDLALKEESEHIKRLFLKDGLYPQGQEAVSPDL